MNILSPITVTDAMIGAATSIAEPAAGETTWVSGGTYVVGDLRIRATTHRVYACVLGHTGITALPENDATRWLEKSPTQRYAPFDIYTSTAANTVSSMTYVLTPGYFNALALYGLTGITLNVTLRDATGGAVIYSSTQDLSEPPPGLYEYLFSPRKVINKIIIKDLPIRPASELTVTVTAATGQPVGIGMLNVGDFISLLGDGAFGGTQYGASAEPVSYSFFKFNPDGTTQIVRRVSATSMRATVLLPGDQADQALRNLQSVLDVPVSWVATDKPGYAGLNVFGLGSASVSYDGVSLASLNLNIKGLI
jgi:hypothetical protein